MEIKCILLKIWGIFMQLFSLMFMIALASSRGNEVERLSLLAFKSEVDTLGILSSWNDTSNLCSDWHGITCDRRHQRVTVLDLQSSQLRGTLPPHIGNLSFLRILKLQNNSFVYTIPQEVGRLSRLQVLHLGDNMFSGNIPINLSRCSNLQYLVLANNSLSGKLPTEFVSLLKLQVLALSRNILIGEIPPSFGNLSSLKTLSLEENRLQGGIPNRLGQLKNLTHLELGTNNLNGSIPPSIYNISSIRYISVILNLLEGSLPPGLGYTTFPNLEIFQFQFNRFSGPIPFTISNASHLSHFGISDNIFTGSMPSLATLSNLVRLEMGNNHLGNVDGDLRFLSSLTNCSRLQILDISGNNFQGVLPESISNFSTMLNAMRLGGNQLSGNIPIGIGNLINLGVLGFEENLLTGTIPESVGNLSRLYGLFLNHNQLSGFIPSSLGSLTLLSSLHLMSNHLQGDIPQRLGLCNNLLDLYLSRNNLNGSIPQEVLSLPILIRLDLSSNNFKGHISMEVRFSSNLGVLDLSENRLSGEILQSVGGSTSLESLDLSENKFHGTISESLRSLRGLQNLDLSRNHFSGIIPSYFQDFQYLQNLNMSFNDFRDEVPIRGVFSNASAVSVIGNKRLCGGIPLLKLHKCAFFNQSRAHILHKLTIITLSFGAIVIWLLYIVLLYRSREARVRPPAIPALDVSFLKLSYGDLLKATNGFSSRNLIGSGSSGSVYWGVILDQHEEIIVAVKVLNLQSSRAIRSFNAECQVLKSMRHRNLVKLVTACSSIDFQGNEFKALIFEFMLDGNLDEWLHHPAQRVVDVSIVKVYLSFLQRVKIAIDIASALDYLHNRFHIRVVHCDLKPSNVLLEKDMTACVCDFGLATYLPDPSCPATSLENVTNSIKGTVGYIAPEYGMGSAVSTYGDVYSYGILLLEMLTGKRPTDDMFRDDMNLHKFVLTALPHSVKDICDPVLLQGIVSNISTSNPAGNRNDDQRQRFEECLIAIARIGLACSVINPKARMEIGKVVAELRIVRDVLTGTRTPIDLMIIPEDLQQ